MELVNCNLHKSKKNLEDISADDLTDKLFYVHIRLCEPKMLNRVRCDNASRYIPNNCLSSSLNINAFISLSFLASSSIFPFVRISIE